MRTIRGRRAPTRGGKTKNSIRQSALRCFARSGVDGSTTKEIARETGVTEGALYRHYASKEEIAQSVFQDCARRLVERLDERVSRVQEFPAKVAGVVRAFWDFAREDPASFKLLAQDHFSRVSHLPRRTRLPKDVVIELCRSAPGRLAPGDPALSAAFLIGLILRSIQFRLVGLVTMKPERFVGEVVAAAQRVLGVTS